MDNGVILIAVQHPHYIQLAVNLAISIKHNDPNQSITLFYDNDLIKHLNKTQRKYFDFMIEIKEDLYVIDGIKHYGLLKLRMHELAQMTEYKNIVYMDVDSIMLPDKTLVDIFSNVDKYSFCTECKGSINSSIASNKSIGGWASFGEIANKFQFNGDIPAYINTAWVGFTVGDTITQNIFSNAQIIFFYYLRYGNYKKWYGTISDQLPLAIAIGMCGFKPEYELNLCYSANNYEVAERAVVLSDYIFFTLPTGDGDATSVNVQFYNELMSYYERKSTQHRATHWRNKRIVEHNKNKIAK